MPSSMCISSDVFQNDYLLRECGDTHVSAMRTRTMHMGVTTCVLKSVKREISARYEDVVL